MTCFIARNLLSELVDDALEPARAHGLRSHLAGCPDCARELEELRGLRSALRSMPVRRAPADFLEKVRAKAERKSVLERVAGIFAPLVRLPRAAQGGLALAASLVVAVTVHFNNDQGGKSVWDMADAPGARVVVQAKSTPSSLAGEAAVPADGQEAVPAEDEEAAVMAKDPVEGAPAAGLSALTEAPPPPPAPAKAKLAKDDADLAGAGKGAGGFGVGTKPQQEVAGGATRGRPSAPTSSGTIAAQATSPSSVANNRGIGAAGASSGASGRSGGSGPVEPGLYASDPASAPARVAATPAATRRPSGAGTAERNRTAARDQAASGAEPSFDDAPAAAPEPSFGARESSVAARRAEPVAKESKKSAPAAAAAPAAQDAWGSGAGDSSAVEDDAFASYESAPVAEVAPADERSFGEEKAEAEAAPAPAKAAEKRADAKPTTVGIRYRSAEPDAPRKVADAARARRGTVVSGNPPSLGRAGASTVVVIEIPADELAGFRTFLEDFGTLELLATPSGSRLRLRVEVIRE